MTDTDASFDELRNLMNQAHRTFTGRDDVPAEIWMRVRSQIPQNPPTEKPLMETTLTQVPAYNVPPRSTPAQPSTSSRYLNLAASVVIVAAIAFGGWFATMRFQPSNDGNGLLGLAQSTPVAQTCDVEPLTVDQVMQIVKNPWEFGFSQQNPSTEFSGPEFTEVSLRPSTAEFDAATRTKPAEKDFEGAIAVANSYLACLPTASWGQIWALSDPVWVQSSILAHFPVFANEPEVREFIEGRIDEPLSVDHNPLDDIYALADDQSIVANPDIDAALTIWPGNTSNSAMLFVAFGVLVTNDDGSIVLESNAEGESLEYQIGSSRQRPTIVVGQSSADGSWYIAPWLNSYAALWEYQYATGE